MIDANPLIFLLEVGRGRVVPKSVTTAFNPFDVVHQGLLIQVGYCIFKVAHHTYIFSKG